MVRYQQWWFINFQESTHNSDLETIFSCFGAHWKRYWTKSWRWYRSDLRLCWLELNQSTIFYVLYRWEWSWKTSRCASETPTKVEEQQLLFIRYLFVYFEDNFTNQYGMLRVKKKRKRKKIGIKQWWNVLLHAYISIYLLHSCGPSLPISSHWRLDFAFIFC